MKTSILSLMLAAGLLPFAAEANLATFSNKATFLSATEAASATGALPPLGSAETPVQIGSVTFTGGGLFVGGYVWTSLLEGNEIALGFENLDVAFDALVYSAGFDFAEPGIGSTSSPYATTPGYPYADSTFTVTLKNNVTTVGAFTFNAPDEVASFVGVWSDAAFNRVEIRETTGGGEDDYFGQFYTGGIAMPVPEPETYALMLAGLGLVGFAARRRATFSF
jgi:hypothetical protein